ncbi:serine hydrolase domain-containing protein [Streptomyces sp. Je 1-369]|uniref:serine hydrolase domain-containing protein n=1 Tax=Streptomyces sp. Je 1-369 TaxID=2966192 RepID=UPI002286033E|nr:serine hydrolase domain-containing protein [Streptomyces sp. Je 1-369]WAL93337.1 beta-lactamase family protein [Streptomyces sp. Je 1-369]
MSARTSLAGMAALAAVAAVTAGALVAPAVAAPAPAPPHPHGAAGGRHAPTQRAMDAAVEDGVPGVTGQAKDAYGTWNGTSGVGDLTTGRPRGPRDHYRIGSVTKTFVATVLLQLAGEGKLDLDDTVDDWLPGLVRGNGHDGKHITVRQLLNHTSGIYDYYADDDFAASFRLRDGFFEHRYDTWRPEQLVAVAMRHEPTSATPGKTWHYSDTNYIVAGMILEKVTGHAYADEVRTRIIEPLGLRGTTIPRTGAGMPRPSSRAYSKLSDDSTGPSYDVTEFNPSAAWTSGGMISDSADLNRFHAALLGGRLLPERQLAEMTTTVPMSAEHPEAARYGLGIAVRKLSCGQEVWGHHGGILGSTTESVATTDGRHALSFNFNADWTGDSDAVIEAEFCGSRKGAGRHR